jgi:hypothetical protein
MSNVLDLNTAKRISQLEAEQRIGRVDAADIRARLHADPKAFVQWLFSGRAFCSRHEARIGNVNGAAGSSLSIALAGQDAGLWKDHATGEGGDLIALFMAYMGYNDGRSFQLALKEIARDFLGDPIQIEKPAWQRSARDHIEEKRRTLGDKPRADMLELGAPVATWKYFDTSGNVLASVVRFEPDGTPDSKTYRPFCFKTVEGHQRWVMGAPALRPLFRLPEIVLASTVVLVEGEKCAEELAKIGIEATTAMQGAESPVEKTDWSPLNGKTIIVWSDNDAPGIAYGKRVTERLLAIGCTVRLVTIPADVPEKWDAADCIAEGRDPRPLLEAATPVDAGPVPRIRLLDIDDFESLRPPTWRIKGILPEQGLTILWGRSGDLKSFVGVDIGLCVATGAPWHGHEVTKGLVIYIAAEGSTGLAKRALGWWRTRGKDYPKPDFKLIPHSLALTGDDLQPLLDAVTPLKPALIIVDTLARTFGTGDENKQADMSAYVTAADKLREATGANILVIHHSGVHEDKRERGSNVLRGAADTVIKVSRKGDKLTLINSAPEGKQKDAEEFATIKLRTAKVTYQHNGIDHSTLILNLDDQITPTEGDENEQTEVKLGKVEQAILAALKEAKEPRGFTWLALATGANPGSVTRSLSGLEGKNLVHLVGQEPRQWALV